MDPPPRLGNSKSGAVASIWKPGMGPEVPSNPLPKLALADEQKQERTTRKQAEHMNKRRATGLTVVDGSIPHHVRGCVSCRTTRCAANEWITHRPAGQ
jgi:hypothetical protein